MRKLSEAERKGERWMQKVIYCLDACIWALLAERERERRIWYSEGSELVSFPSCDKEVSEEQGYFEGKK